MIKGLIGKAGVAVTGSDTSLPYIPPSTENPMQGMIRISGTDLQVFNSSSWMTIPSSYATATLDESAQNVMDWAKKKKNEEEFLISLPNDHPAVKIARENLNKARHTVTLAEEQLKITEILSKDYDQTTS